MTLTSKPLYYSFNDLNVNSFSLRFIPFCSEYVKDTFLFGLEWLVRMTVQWYTTYHAHDDRILVTPKGATPKKVSNPLTLF